MFTQLKQFSLTRAMWGLLALSALLLELTALYFQHGMGLQPCVMCIYERVAMLGLLFAGVVGMIAPNKCAIRWGALLIGIFSAIKGLLLALKHTEYQLDPKPWHQCPLIPEFPETLPLHQWFPSVFQAGGLCKDISWQFLGLAMPQWLIGIFAFYALALILIAFSQFKRLKNTRRNLFH